MMRCEGEGDRQHEYRKRRNCDSWLTSRLDRGMDRGIERGADGMGWDGMGGIVDGWRR